MIARLLRRPGSSRHLSAGSKPLILSALLCCLAPLPALANSACEGDDATRLTPSLAAQATDCRVEGILSPILGGATLYTNNAESPRALAQVPIARGVRLLRSFLWQGQRVFLLGRPPQTPSVPRASGSVIDAPAHLTLDTGNILATHLENGGALNRPKSHDAALLITPQYKPQESFSDRMWARFLGEPEQSPLASLARKAPGPMVMLPLGAGREVPSALALLPHPPPPGLLTAFGLPDMGSGATFLAPPPATPNP